MIHLAVGMIRTVKHDQPTQTRHTAVSFSGQSTHINGQPTYPGRTYNGHKIEGLLMNARFVQATFDDENPATRHWWKLPDGSAFDPDRNTEQFVAQMPEWKRSGLLAFTINCQGGSPRGYSKEQPWRNSAFTPEGELKPAYMGRIEKVIDRADELGMVVILGYFYFGQTQHFVDEVALVRATDSVTDWLTERGYTNVLVEIANECNHWDYPPILHPPRAHELIERVQQRSAGKLMSPGGRLLVSTSLLGQAIPNESIAQTADFILLHGNGTKSPQHFREQIRAARKVSGYRGQPVLCNEDDHFDFDKPDNNFVAAAEEYASWGYFDYRFAGEGFEEGYQSVPADWGTNSARKRGFFDLLRRVTGA